VERFRKVARRSKRDKCWARFSKPLFASCFHPRLAGGAQLEVSLPGTTSPVTLDLPSDLDPGTCRVKLRRKMGQLVVTLMQKGSLSDAVERGDLARIETLLQAGCSPEDGSNGKLPPLCLAAAQGSSDIVAALLRAGACLDARTSEEGNAGQTALHVACWNLQASTVRQLLLAGAEADAIDEDDETPLMVAARLGSLELVKMLVQAGANPRRRDANGWVAAGKAAVRGHTQTANYLLPLLGDCLREGDLGGLPLPPKQTQEAFGNS